MPTVRALTKIIVICVLLAGVTWLVFGQTVRHEFVNFDDGAYVYRNFDVAHGISFDGVKWAFTNVVAANWHPLTMLSHMLDCRLYGVTPGGHHFTNVLLHTIAVIALFLTLNWMTGALWRSAFVAAVFAIHPLHVESVAWVAERKDVLSGVFFMLSIAAYVYYTRSRTLARYALMSILFAAGLMAKPMLVTLPLVFLLLDYWPLRRLTTPFSTIPEKLPLFALSAAASVLTLLTQNPGLNSLNRIPFLWRIENACLAIIIYIRQTLLPLDLACFYPYPLKNPPFWEILISAMLVAGLTAGAWVLRNRRPYLLTGWLWYLVMLIPVVGIIQVGRQAHADRYTYLPQIGLVLIITWTIADLSRHWWQRTAVLGFLAVIVMVPLTWGAFVQTSYWHDSESLWRHDLKVANNPTAHNSLCDALLEKKKNDEAISEARRALEMEPESADVLDTLGAALTRKGQLDEALAYLNAAAESKPMLPRLHYNLGNVFLEKGEVDEAIKQFETEVRIQPNFPEARNNLANALFRKGKPKEAQTHLDTALKLNPNYAEAHNNLAIALSQTGDIREAIAQWNKTLLIQPDNLDAHCNLTWVLATSPDDSVRDGSAAAAHAQRAIVLSEGKNAKIWRLAAAAYAEAGRFDDAIKAAHNGLALAEGENNAGLVRTLQANIELFQTRQPLRDVSTTASPQ